MTERTIRREDALLLTGGGRYTADWNLPGQLHAFFLRSDRAHAEIVSIDAKGALASAGVRLVLTGTDYAASEWKSLPGGVPYEGVGGQKQKKPFWPALAHKKVHYVGSRSRSSSPTPRRSRRTRPRTSQSTTATFPRQSVSRRQRVPARRSCTRTSPAILRSNTNR